MRKFITAFALFAALVGVVTYDMAEIDRAQQEVREITHYGPAF